MPYAGKHYACEWKNCTSILKHCFVQVAFNLGSNRYSPVSTVIRVWVVFLPVLFDTPEHLSVLPVLVKMLCYLSILRSRVKTGGISVKFRFPKAPTPIFPSLIPIRIRIFGGQTPMNGSPNDGSTPYLKRSLTHAFLEFIPTCKCFF